MCPKYYGFSMLLFLRKRRREENARCGGFLYLFHQPRESKATQMRSELLVKSRAGIFYIICFPSYIVYCKCWLVENCMIIKPEKVCERSKNNWKVLDVSLFYDLKKRIDSDVKKVSFTMTKAIMYSDTPRAFPSYSRYSVNYAVQRL